MGAEERVESRGSKPRQREKLNFDVVGRIASTNPMECSGTGWPFRPVPTCCKGMGGGSLQPTHSHSHQPPPSIPTFPILPPPLDVGSPPLPPRVVQPLANGNSRMDLSWEPPAPNSYSRWRNVCLSLEGDRSYVIFWKPYCLPFTFSSIILLEFLFLMCYRLRFISLSIRISTYSSTYWKTVLSPLSHGVGTCICLWKPLYSIGLFIFPCSSTTLT